MKKQIILPLASLIFITLILFAIIIPVSRDFLTGLVIMPQQYSIEGQIKIISPVEIYKTCHIEIEFRNEETNKTKKVFMNSDEFKEKSQLIKEDNYFVYLSEIQDLTKEIILDEGGYYITIRVYCDAILISQIQEYFMTS
jgi:hypothetical protein